MSYAVKPYNNDDDDNDDDLETAEPSGVSSAIGSILASNNVAQSAYAWEPDVKSRKEGNKSSSEALAYPTDLSEPSDTNSNAQTTVSSNYQQVDVPIEEHPAEADAPPVQAKPTLAKALKNLARAEKHMDRIEKALRDAGSYQELLKAQAYVANLIVPLEKMCPDRVDEKYFLETISSNNSTAIKNLIDYNELAKQPIGYLLTRLQDAVKVVELQVQNMEAAPKPKDIGINLKNDIPALEEPDYMRRRTRLSVRIANALDQMHDLTPLAPTEPKMPKMETIETALANAEGSNLPPKLLNEVRETLLNGLKPIEEKLNEYGQANLELDEVKRELCIIGDILGLITFNESTPIYMEFQKLQTRAANLYEEFGEMIYNLVKKLKGWDLRASPELHTAKLAIIEECLRMSSSAAARADQDDFVAASEDPTKADDKSIEQAIWEIFHGSKTTYNKLPDYLKESVDDQVRQQAIERMTHNFSAPLTLVLDWAEWETELRKEVQDGAAGILASSIRTLKSTRGYEDFFASLLDENAAAHVKDLGEKVLKLSKNQIEQLLLSDCKSKRVHIKLAERLIEKLDLKKSEAANELPNVSREFSIKYFDMLATNPVEAFKYAKQCSPNFDDLLPALLNRIPAWFSSAKLTVREAMEIHNEVRAQRELQSVEASMAKHLGVLMQEKLSPPDLLIADDFCRNILLDVDAKLAVELEKRIADVRSGHLVSEIIRLLDTAPIQAFYLWLPSGQPWPGSIDTLGHALSSSFLSGDIPLARALRFFKDEKSIDKLEPYRSRHIELMANTVEKQLAEGTVDPALAKKFATEFLQEFDKTRAQTLLDKLSAL